MITGRYTVSGFTGVTLQIRALNVRHGSNAVSDWLPDEGRKYMQGLTPSGASDLQFSRGIVPLLLFLRKFVSLIADTSASHCE